MEKTKNPYELQLFICTNKKDRGECCADKGGIELRNELKSLCKERFGRRVRVNAAGCMGGCERGIVAAMYPQDKWFEKVTTDDKQELLDKVAKWLGDEK